MCTGGLKKNRRIPGENFLEKKNLWKKVSENLKSRIYHKGKNPDEATRSSTKLHEAKAVASLYFFYIFTAGKSRR